MASGGDPDEIEFEDMLEQVNKNPDYKVLTKHQYESLLAIASSRDRIPATSTPSSPVAQTTRREAEEVICRPKVSISKTAGRQQPSMSPGPRLQLLLNGSQKLNESKLNKSYAAQPFSYPKLPFFSGSEEPQKGETSYEVWNFEVQCLQNENYLPDHVLMQSIRNSLKGPARSLLVPLGANASVDDVLHKLDGFYGNVSTSETLIQSFYNDYQKESESIATYASRLEQTLSRAINSGHLDLAAKDAMLRSKFWTGLKSQQLRNSTRHLYDSIKDFQDLLREIRKVDQEINSSRPLSSKTPKTAQQQSSQASSEESASNSQLLKQMTELMSRMKTLEQKLGSQQQALAASNASPSYNQYDYNNQSSFGRRGGGRGYQRGYSNRAHSGRGFRQSNDFRQGNDFQGRGNFQNSNRSGFGGGDSGGYRGGASARGTYRGGVARGDNRPLN